MIDYDNFLTVQPFTFVFFLHIFNLIVKTYFILKSSIHRTAHFFESVDVCRCSCNRWLFVATAAAAAVGDVVVQAQNDRLLISINRPLVNRRKQLINTMFSLSSTLTSSSSSSLCRYFFLSLIDHIHWIRIFIIALYADIYFFSFSKRQRKIWPATNRNCDVVKYNMANEIEILRFKLLEECRWLEANRNFFFLFSNSNSKSILSVCCESVIFYWGILKKTLAKNYVKHSKLSIYNAHIINIFSDTSFLY